MISARTDQDTIASTNLQRLRKIRPLNPRSSKPLLAYAAAAGAVCSTQAMAEVVYTPAHISLKSSDYFLDLNHDGINDFELRSFNSVLTQPTGYLLIHCLVANPLVNGNRIIGNDQGFATACPASVGEQTAALKAGAVIGTDALFQATANLMGSYLVFMPKPGSCSSGRFSSGPWPNAGYRFLGLVFEINGKEHFGWARISVEKTNGLCGRPFYTAIGGYAYETIPGKPIVAGDVGVSAQSVPEPTLGVLALGTPGLDLWRREEGEE
jgi:hypothetical protein